MTRPVPLLLLAFCLVARTPSAAAWETLSDAEAAAAGWSRGKLAEARTHAATLKTEAVMIIAQGKVLDAWGAVDQKFNAHSIRKSFLSALFGVRVAEGVVDLDASMADLGIDDNEPGLTEAEKRATVHDLLKARSGIYHPALYETPGMKAKRPKRHSHEPGSFWYYNNWDFNALGTIYERACRTGIFEDFERLIAGPLGMEDYEVADGGYVTGPDSIHPAYPFRMSARDMARFGLLYLRMGRWNDRQIVPEEWVRASIRTHSGAGASGGYGYLWWTCENGAHLPGITLPEGSYSARGAGGHYILNIPALDLVIVHRVNTDIKDQSVSASEFGELVRRILAACQPPAGARLETIVPLLMTRHRVPGAAVLRLSQGRLASEHYFGCREAGKAQPVDAETVFEAASMTKPLAAHTALKLAERGLLDLDRPLASYLEEPYLQGEPRHEKITARMVLSHTSGFPNWRPRGGALKVMHEPGTAFLYSGEGFQFLQRALEQITGESFESLQRRLLLGPLGMTHSSHVWSEGIAAHAAAGHDAEGRVKPGRAHYNRPYAAYSLYTTGRDYAAFVTEMMRTDREGAHSLSAESVRLMLTPASPPTAGRLLSRQGSRTTGEIRFGLGWSIEPAASGPRIRHSGSNGTGFRSYAEFDPEAGHGLIIMTNADRGDALWRELVEFMGTP
jgi:CubicO group peptidase (beta-lactamase class C family)